MKMNHWYSPGALMRLGLTTVLSMSALLSSVRSASADKLAILVGIDDYAVPAMKLSYCGSDARALSDVLSKKAGFTKDNIWLLTSQSKEKATLPTRSNIAACFATVAKLAKPDDSVFFFFSGHGTANRRTVSDETAKDEYLIVADTDVEHQTSFQTTAISPRALKEWISPIKAGQITLLLDTHSNRIFAREMLAAAQSAQGGKAKAVVLSACSPGESTFEDPKLKAGIFSYYLTQGLRGEAKNENGQVTLKSLSVYVHDATVAHSKKLGMVQTPWLEQIGSENMVFVPNTAP